MTALTIISDASSEGCSRIVAVWCPQPGWVTSILFFSTPALYAGVLDTIHLVQCQDTSTKHLDTIALIPPTLAGHRPTKRPQLVYEIKCSMLMYLLVTTTT